MQANTETATVHFRDHRHSLAVVGSGTPEMEKSIFLLDSCPASGGEGSSKGTMGCNDSHSGVGHMGQVSAELNSASLFFFDSTGSTLPPGGWEMFGVYSRNVDSVLGDTDDDEDVGVPGDRRCFNCGSIQHVLSVCPHPRNRELTRLALSLHELYKELRADAGDVRGAPRFHDIGEWKAQRLEWVDYFEPGQIRGELLREAVGNDGGDWLRNIARLGYPRGWTGERDPREKMKETILRQFSGRQDPDGPFTVYGEDDDDENIVFAASSTIPTPDESTSEPRRWAHYPPSHFLSHLLPLYVPPPTSPEALYFVSPEEEYSLWKQEFWERILLTLPPGSSLEQYYHAYFYYIYLYASLPPPEPTSQPPPLPPSVESEDDMDLSD